MTKKELVDLIADKRDLSAQMVLTVVEDFMKIIHRWPAHFSAWLRCFSAERAKSQSRPKHHTRGTTLYSSETCTPIPPLPPL